MRSSDLLGATNTLNVLAGRNNKVVRFVAWPLLVVAKSPEDSSATAAQEGSEIMAKQLRDVKEGDVIKVTRYGTKWTVREKREPRGPFKGYIVLRSAKGTRNVIGSRSWDIPIHSIIDSKPNPPSATHAHGGTRERSETMKHTPGPWNFEPCNPGCISSKHEPPDPGHPALIFAEHPDSVKSRFAN